MSSLAAWLTEAPTCLSPTRARHRHETGEQAGGPRRLPNECVVTVLCSRSGRALRARAPSAPYWPLATVEEAVVGLRVGWEVPQVGDLPIVVERQDVGLLHVEHGAVGSGRGFA